MRLVTIIAATPTLAAIANSLMVGTGISRIVIKPMVSVSNATPPGIKSSLNALRAATEASSP